MSLLTLAIIEAAFISSIIESPLIIALTFFAVILGTNLPSTSTKLQFNLGFRMQFALQEGMRCEYLFFLLLYLKFQQMHNMSF